jgi:hypothetical protein
MRGVGYGYVLVCEPAHVPRLGLARGGPSSSTGDCYPPVVAVWPLRWAVSYALRRLIRSLSSRARACCIPAIAALAYWLPEVQIM